MSRFYGSIQGDASKTIATRRGLREIMSHTRGWNYGIKVYADECPSCGADRMTVYTTGGSNSIITDELVLQRCSADCQK